VPGALLIKKKYILPRVGFFVLYIKILVCSFNTKIHRYPACLRRKRKRKKVAWIISEAPLLTTACMHL
jgi:hypothetical protein